MNFHTKMLLNLIFPIIISNYSNIVLASFVMYCDLEAMITKEVKVNRGKIQNKNVHVPIAVGAITVCRPRKEFGSPPMIYTEADCIYNLKCLG